MGRTELEVRRYRPARRRLGSLVGLGGPGADAVSIEEICETVCDRARELIRADGACVSQYVTDADAMVHSVCTGILHPLVGARFDVDGSLSGAALRHRRSVIENDLAHTIGDTGVRSLTAPLERGLAVPLVSLRGAVGTLCLVRSAGGAPFSESDARLLEGYAVPVAFAIDRAERLEEAWVSMEVEAQLRRNTEDLVSDLRRLHTAEIAIASHLDLEATLDSVVRTAAELTGARRAALGLVHPTERGFDRFVHADDGTKRSGGEREPDDPIDCIIREGRPVCVHSEAGSCPGCDVGPVSARMLGMPIQLHGELLGVLYLSDKTSDATFTDRDEAIVRMLSAQAAVVIDKARLLEERLDAIHELEKARAVRSRLSAYVNHDIRNALQSVALWADRLADLAPGQDDAPKLGECAVGIDDGTAYALRLVRDVLDLEAMEEGRLETWPRSFSVDDLLRSALDGLEPDAARASMVVEIDCEGGLRLVADPDRVRQIVTNLLHNALKFAPAGSSVRLAARRHSLGPDGAPGAWVSIDVEDEGPGIAEEDVARIFTAYERGMSGRRENGTGLGLTISRFLADHMGGQLLVRTAPAKGSTFTVWLPGDREPESKAGWIG